MLLELILTLLLGLLLLRWGLRLGRLLVRQGATANDLFKDKPAVSLAFLGAYVGLLLLALNVPQMQALPLEWRFYGMRVTWTLMRVLLLGACGVAIAVSWYTARRQLIAVILLGAIGLSGFTVVEVYFLAPIANSLQDNLRSNGVFEQTSLSSCAPAALATLMRVWGIDATESQMARFASTSRMGTTMPQLIIGARSIGFDGVELDPTWEQMQQINRPGILGVWLFDNNGRKLPHAVALLGLNPTTATIADPARGQLFYLDRPTFDQVWRHQYVPIFRPTDARLSRPEAETLLRQSGYTSLKQFQTAMKLPETGNLNLEITLLLQGKNLSDAPRLDRLPAKLTRKFQLLPTF